MALQLHTVTTKLDSLTMKLDYDPDIQIRLRGISSKSVAAANAYKTTLTNEGSNILAKKSVLMSSLSPSEVNIPNLQSSLNAAIRALKANKQQVICLQTDIHSNIESCRERKTKHEFELSVKHSRISSIRSEIESLESSIKANEIEASTVENGAAELDKRAQDIRNAARRKRKKARIGGIIGGVVGVFTGGAGLAMATACAGIHAAININDASDCERNARRLRDEADTKRSQVQTLQSSKSSLDGQKSALESETASLQSSSDVLSDESEVLQEVTNSLCQAIDDIDNILNVFQNMETAMSEALLQTDSFKIIQNAFAQHPEALSSGAQVYLNQLKEKWTLLETVLLQHGAKSISC